MFAGPLTEKHFGEVNIMNTLLLLLLRLLKYYFKLIANTDSQTRPEKFIETQIVIKLN